MPRCFACQEYITNPNDQDILKIISTDAMDSGRLLNDFNYTPSIQLGPNNNYIHFRCASKHADHLGSYHRKEWVEWRIRQLEQEQTENRTLMEEITSAIKHINPDAYYDYIEEPSLNRQTRAKPETSE